MLCCCAPRPSPQLAWLRQLRRLHVRVAVRCQLARLTLGPTPRRLQQYSSPDCAKGSESGNPFAPSGGSAEDAKRPQSATLAFGVCFKDRKDPPRPAPASPAVPRWRHSPSRNAAAEPLTDPNASGAQRASRI